MTNQEKAQAYDHIQEFVADTINTRNVQFGLPSGRTEPHEAWGFRQIVKRYFPDLDPLPSRNPDRQ